MIIIQSSLQLAAADADNPLATPAIGYDNLVTTGNTSATSEATDHPATNLANPQTFNYWEALDTSPATVQYLTFLVNAEDPLDYVGIAGHNLGSLQCPVSIEAYNELVGSPLQPDWQEIVEPVQLGDDGPAVFRWDPQAYIGVRIKIGVGNGVPRVAVAYCGKLLVFPRGTHTEHVPINLARELFITSGMSERGQFLGRIETGRTLQTTFTVKALTNSFVRNQLDPFLTLSPAFFWAWASVDFPRDVGFCWLMNNPKPSWDYETKRFNDVTLNLQGFAL